MIVIPIGRAPRQTVRTRECVTFKCAHCGSERVTKDGDLGWDKVLQKWVVESEFETASCKDCGTDTRLVAEVIS
jgi:transcription elongation factor Elf1